MYEKVLKENEKIRKDWKVVEEKKKGVFRQPMGLIEISEQTAVEKAIQAKINFEKEVYNDDMTARVYINVKFTHNEKIVIQCVSALLWERSQNTTDYKSEDFMIGDGVVTAGRRGREVHLMIDENDVAREYRGGGQISGIEAKRIRKTLDDIANKVIQLRYKLNDGNYFIDSGVPLWRYVRIESGDGKIVKKGGIIVHPIFIEGLKDRYVIKPRGFLKLLNDAAGRIRSTRDQSTEGDGDLFDLLARYATNKGRSQWEINEETLLKETYPKLLIKREISKAREKLRESVMICEDLKLITRWHIDDNKSGGKKYVFELNNNWYKELSSGE
jgi:hypothetical protein